jgi:DNA repair protein RadC
LSDNINKSEGHRTRLKDKYLEYGIESLTDSEVVELLLMLGTPRRDVKQAARMAIKSLGGLREVLSADAQTLATIPGLGEKNTIALRLIRDTANRFLRSKIVGRSFLENPREIFDFLYHRLRDRKVEVLTIIFLNSQNEILRVEEPFPGLPTQSLADIRVILRRAMELDAAGLVLAHNHPSGYVDPSEPDCLLTEKFTTAADALGINLVDHLIIGDNRYYSFSESGLLASYKSRII